MKSKKVIFCMFFVVAIHIVGGYGIRFNISESLPNKLFFSFPLSSLKIDQIVTFKLLYSDVTFAKKIGGLPGDFIEVKDKIIFINGMEKAKIISENKPIEAGIIPEGYCFMLGEHERSFDSRYFEFGLVPNECIKEQLCPIF